MTAGPKPEARTGGPRPRLSRDDVARRALEFLDAHGLEGLSMRRLAGEIGVGTMTLYGYFASKDELLDAVVDAAVTDREIPLEGGSWQDRLRRLMHFTHDAVGRHPALVKLRAERPVLRPEALRFCEQTMTILLDAGFAKADAARAFRLFFTYVLGFALFSPAGSEQDAAAASRRAMLPLDPDEYPSMLGASRELAGAMAGTDAFGFGLDTIIAGLESRLKAAGG